MNKADKAQQEKVQEHALYSQHLRKALKNLLFACATLFFVLILMLIASEIVLRLFFPQQEPMNWFKSDSRYGYLNKENFHQKYDYVGFNFTMDVETNSFGHRYKEYDKSTFDDSSTIKVLLIGDSFTFGYGVNIKDHFAVKLERLLRQRGKYAIINSGVGGWGTLQAFKYARDNFDRFKPNVIVYTFCQNDPDDDVKFLMKLKDNERGVISFPGKKWIKGNLQLYMFFFTNYHKILHELMLRKKIAEQGGGDKNIDIQTRTLINEPDWHRVGENINSFYGDFIRFNPQGLLLLQTAVPWSEIYRNQLSNLQKPNNLIYVDMYEETIAIPEEEKRLPHDGHWSKQVHAIVAKKLSETILSHASLYSENR